nr:unnamed protein product [Spirometra erinaceieuropaei]
MTESISEGGMLRSSPAEKYLKSIEDQKRRREDGIDEDVSASCGEIASDLAIETIEVLLQSKYDETENRLGHAQILQLLKLCLRTYFTFDGKIYEQVKGTPMGSPISGFIAEAVLQRLESLVFQHHRPKFWARYVDDTFVVIERKTC